MCFRKAEDGPSRDKGKVKRMKRNEELKKTAVLGKPLADPKEANRKIRAWMLRVHPEEKPMIGDFRKDVTFADVNRRMHDGEVFSDICECSESEQRIKVFSEMMEMYGTTYDYWYRLSLDNAWRKMPRKYKRIAKELARSFAAKRRRTRKSGK